MSELLSDARTLEEFLAAHPICALYFSSPDCAVCSRRPLMPMRWNRRLLRLELLLSRRTSFLRRMLAVRTLDALKTDASVAALRQILAYVTHRGIEPEELTLIKTMVGFQQRSITR